MMIALELGMVRVTPDNSASRQKTLIPKIPSFSLNASRRKP
jgi:hypothetical protein